MTYANKALAVFSKKYKADVRHRAKKYVLLEKYSSFFLYKVILLNIHLPSCPLSY